MSDRLAVLMSYPYLKPDVVRTLVEFQDDLDIFIDCGAVTAHASGTRIKLDDYCRCIEALPFTPWRYMALDEIGNPAVTWTNYQEMLRRGFTPVPCFTRNEKMEHLDVLYQTSDLVAAGGLVTRSGFRRAYLQQFMARAAGRKVHLLGKTDLRIVKAVRPYSCDSSSWEYGARYAMIYVYMGNGRLEHMRRWHAYQRPQEKFIEAVRALGHDPYALQRDEAWRGGRSLARKISAASWVALQRDARKHIGTILFMAAANDQALRALVAAHLQQTGRAHEAPAV